jgi:hypothetical protein
MTWCEPATDTPCALGVIGHGVARSNRWAIVSPQGASGATSHACARGVVVRDDACRGPFTIERRPVVRVHAFTLLGESFRTPPPSAVAATNSRNAATNVTVTTSSLPRPMARGGPRCPERRRGHAGLRARRAARSCAWRGPVRWPRRVVRLRPAHHLTGSSRRSSGRFWKWGRRIPSIPADHVICVRDRPFRCHGRMLHRKRRSTHGDALLSQATASDFMRP